MTIKFKLGFFLLCFAALHSNMLAQNGGDNIYSYSNSLKFAEHLSRIKDYKYASMEYERLLALKPEKDSLCMSLLQSYRLGGEWDLGIQSFHFHRPNIEYLPPFLSHEFLKLLILKEDFKKIDFFLKNNGLLPNNYKEEISLSSFLLQKDWNIAYDYSLAHQIHDPLLLSYAKKGVSLKVKKPIMAGFLSVLVPGLGKVYAGDWKNGLSSLLMVGTSVFAASRGFNARGINSGMGWVFTGLGTVFYMSSIYGSHKEAKNYNYKKSEDLKNEVADYLHSNF